MFENGSSSSSNHTTGINARPMQQQRLLFQKILSSSDVGRFNRLVIPSVQARAHFPTLKIDENMYKVEILRLIDNQNRTWEVKFEFLPRNRTFVLSRGWKKFVRHHDLRKDGVIRFYEIINSERNHLHYSVEYENPPP
uniref:TF-B3 domain-containing protein n=1 Tax=Nelumbo nucifera TaxID=4432 RepID=A0A822XZ00_NELNU|nr:TPA_asm: hypothetical protein HUJ06_025478 [Nelumbo nucifera]